MKPLTYTHCKCKFCPLIIKLKRKVGPTAGFMMKQHIWKEHPLEIMQLLMEK